MKFNLNKNRSILLVPILLIVSGLIYYTIQRKNLERIYAFLSGKKTVEDILKKNGEKVDKVFSTIFSELNTKYPPDNLTLIAFKQEQILEVWTVGSEGKIKLVKKYPFTAMSGSLGPKLIRGDGQIPEGFYKIESLNPNSAFYLSLKINFPNDFDLEKAREDNRTDPGDNIFIHGKNQSVGCIAIGDEAIEELFVLAARIPRSKIDVIIFPYDMRNFKEIKYCIECPEWTKNIYNRLKIASLEFHSSK